MIFCRASFQELISRPKELSIFDVSRTEYLGLVASVLYSSVFIGQTLQSEEINNKIYFANSYQLHEPLLQ